MRNSRNEFIIIIQYDQILGNIEKKKFQSLTSKFWISRFPCLFRFISYGITYINIYLTDNWKCISIYCNYNCGECCHWNEKDSISTVVKYCFVFFLLFPWWYFSWILKFPFIFHPLLNKKWIILEILKVIQFLTFNWWNIPISRCVDLNMWYVIFY